MKFTLIPRAQVVAVLASAPQPAGGLPTKYSVTLTVEEREQWQALTRAGRIAARTLQHAWILLKADASPAGPAWSDSAIRTAFAVGWSTIARVRQTCVEHGVHAALYPKRPRPRLPTKLDGANEAHLVALAYTTSPTGQERWTLRLRAERFATLEGETISYETVRRVLKKRPQALAEGVLVYPARAERRVRRGDGRCARSVSAAPGSRAAAGVYG